MEKKLTEAEQWYEKNKLLFEQFSEEIEEIITKILKIQGIPYQSIAHRVKSKESYLKKCSKEKYTNPIEEITDVSGIRVIAYTNEEVKKICEILQNEFAIDKEKSVNKSIILETDRVGYRSFHFILQLNESRTNLPEYIAYKDLKCEVQVRTLLQHAWAEIEHDRNYKFAGVLPDEIKRRFHLVAGVLEMMDSEFDRLSRDIDEYSICTEKAVAEGNYNLSIDSKSLEQYGLKRFEGIIDIEPCSDGTIISEEVVQELINFGYDTIQSIENDVNKYIDILAKKTPTTLVGVCRDLMFLKDCNRYFSKAYKGQWQGTSVNHINFLKRNGVSDIDKYIKENKIYISRGDE
ncbi:MAG: hypothetical protein UHN47_15355 [Lachnospiraceae bacterium]|nr:hypothetical protein [Lachnospiraceae bacterium]